jgi:hypothetical protein
MKLSKISTRGDDKYAGIEPSWTNQQGTKSELMSAFNLVQLLLHTKRSKDLCARIHASDFPTKRRDCNNLDNCRFTNQSTVRLVGPNDVSWVQTR